MKLKDLSEAPVAKASDSERLKLYKVLTDNGPDVDAWSSAFTRLANKAKKADLNFDDKNAVYDWLEAAGMFGVKSDRLRARGDKYY